MAHSEKGIQIYEMFKTHLDAHDISYKADEEDLMITLTVNGEDLPQPTVIRVLDDRNVVQIVSPIPCTIPEEKRLDAAVAVAVANRGMVNGCFEYDMGDGTILFRVAQSFAGTDFSDELIRYMLTIVFFTTDKFNDKFFMLAKGMMSLEDFLQKEG